MITVTKLTKTCGACPAQWEGKTVDGAFVYVRYRYGRLTVSLSRESMADAVVATPSFLVSHGDRLNGWMEEDTLRRLVPEIQWPA